MGDGRVIRLFSAGIRVMDAPERHDEITRVTGLVPSHCHRKGDLRVPGSKITRRWENDIWILNSPLEDEEELSEHLAWLWERLEEHGSYFRGLLEANVDVNVFCGYRSNCDTAGFRVEPEALRLFTELGVRMEVSVIIHGMDDD